MIVSSIASLAGLCVLVVVGACGVNHSVNGTLCQCTLCQYSLSDDLGWGPKDQVVYIHVAHHQLYGSTWVRWDRSQVEEYPGSGGETFSWGERIFFGRIIDA